jgi:hypothetical protein
MDGGNLQSQLTHNKNLELEASGAELAMLSMDKFSA